MSAQQIQQSLQKGLEEFQKIQKDIQKMVTGRQQLEAQLNENKLVKDELLILETDANVYKLIGPVLVKQDAEESKLNVQKRIDYINGEMERHEKGIQDLQTKQDTSKDKLADLQAKYQKALTAAAANS